MRWRVPALLAAVLPAILLVGSYAESIGNIKDIAELVQKPYVWITDPQRPEREKAGEINCQVDSNTAPFRNIVTNAVADIHPTSLEIMKVRKAKVNTAPLLHKRRMAVVSKIKTDKTLATNTNNYVNSFNIVFSCLKSKECDEKEIDRLLTHNICQIDSTFRYWIDEQNGTTGGGGVFSAFTKYADGHSCEDVLATRSAIACEKIAAKE